MPSLRFGCRQTVALVVFALEFDGHGDGAQMGDKPIELLFQGQLLARSAEAERHAPLFRHYLTVILALPALVCVLPAKSFAVTV